MFSLDFINQLGESWASFMWYQTLDSTLVLTVIGGLWLMIRKRSSAQLGYCLFLLVLLKLTVPGQFSLLGVMEYLFPDHAVTRGAGGFELVIDERENATSAGDQQSAEEQINTAVTSNSSSFFWSKISIMTVFYDRVECNGGAAAWAVYLDAVADVSPYTEGQVRPGSRVAAAFRAAKEDCGNKKADPSVDRFLGDVAGCMGIVPACFIGTP